ncbi:MAG: hypothetical protein ACKVOU_04945 [Cytophagales bacterium]
MVKAAILLVIGTSEGFGNLISMEFSEENLIFQNRALSVYPKKEKNLGCGQLNDIA